MFINIFSRESDSTIANVCPFVLEQNFGFGSLGTASDWVKVVDWSCPCDVLHGGKLLNIHGGGVSSSPVEQKQQYVHEIKNHYLINK